MNTTGKKFRSLAAFGLLAITVLGSACVPLQLVCDVAADGSESNCKESEI